MKLKRTIAAILAFLALASFAGCRKDKKDDPASTSAGAVAAETSENETETEAQTETETPTATAGKTKESSTAKQTGVRKNEKKISPILYRDRQRWLESLERVQKP